MFQTLLQLDSAVYSFINHLPHPWWFNAFFISVDVLSNGGVVWLLFCLTLILFGGQKIKTLAVWGLLIVIITTVFEELLIKTILVERVRPFLSIPNSMIYGIKPTTYSFPSGQTTNAFAVATFFSFVFKKNIYTFLFFLLSFLTGVGRLYLGAHFPLDVIVGSILGIAIGKVMFEFYQKKQGVSKQNDIVELR